MHEKQCKFVLIYKYCINQNGYPKISIKACIFVNEMEFKLKIRNLLHTLEKCETDGIHVENYSLLLLDITQYTTMIGPKVQ